MKRLILALVLAASAAVADPVVDRTVDGVILPRMAAFAGAAEALAEAAEADCRAESPALRAAWQAAFDAWIPASAFRLGPLEDGGRGLAIAFWPDAKGHAPRALRTLLAGPPETLASGEAYGDVSVAARGLHALELMIYEPEFNAYGPGDPGCALTRAAAADLALTARAVERDWAEDFAPLLKTAGAPENARFLSETEARQAIFTQLLTQLEFDKDVRLGRPLGSLERPRPLRAESRASGRSLRNVRLSLAANEDLAHALSSGGSELVWDDFAYARQVAGRLDDPIFDDVATVGGRFRAQNLADAIGTVAARAAAELGAELGVAPGFNALDGD